MKTNKIHELTSDELELIQNTLKKAIKATLDRPDCDFIKASELLSTMEKIDHNRRLTWNKEKFGVYEKIADQFFKDICSDDIPF